MRKALLITIVTFFFTDCFSQARTSGTVIATGQMPNLCKDQAGHFHLAYGKGDSILYSFSKDGKEFSAPALVSILPRLAASHTRGPQIAATGAGLVITACTAAGNIFSYIRTASGWQRTGKVNDVDTTAKENLMALGADGNKVFAVWLDLRNKHNQIFGARSTDGGRTWSKNILVYASPDTTVCECCKPSVQVKDKHVYVMFRNWLKGNRDLYLIQSADGGKHFGQALKLGTESWALKGCPMDGGGLSLNDKGKVQTVWNRKGSIYACEPGKVETLLGTGRGCVLTTIQDKNVYAWTENGEIAILTPDGKKILAGKGQSPVLKAVGTNEVLCVWENNKQILKTLIAF